QINNRGDYNISSIKYTGHETRDTFGNLLSDRRPFASLDFIYENAPRQVESFVAGRQLLRQQRLKSIISNVSNVPDNVANGTSTIASRYELEYEDRDTANRFVLTRLRQFGDDGSELGPTKFSYSSPKVGWSVASYQFPASAVLADR